jgi:hypothetical protein
MLRCKFGWIAQIVGGMPRRADSYVVRFAGVAFLLALCGCAGMLAVEREPWRREAEIACLQAGAVKEGPTITLAKAINGPGACGVDYPLRVAALGASGITDEQAADAQKVPRPTGGEGSPPNAHLKSERARRVQAASATLTPTATLACPLVSKLDRFVSEKVQPAALRWFRQPVAEIKQISAYSCRGMNGDPEASISEHAFGNALDLAAFVLADGRKITVKDGWHGRPEEQGFLRDVQSAACEMFATVLAPGSNAYHNDHMHVDLMRSASLVCKPAAISGEVAAARAGRPIAAR